jgi:hypothetical protein
VHSSNAQAGYGVRKLCASSDQEDRAGWPGWNHDGSEAPVGRAWLVNVQVERPNDLRFAQSSALDRSVTRFRHRGRFLAFVPRAFSAPSPRGVSAGIRDSGWPVIESAPSPSRTTTAVAAPSRFRSCRNRRRGIPRRDTRRRGSTSCLAPAGTDLRESPSASFPRLPVRGGVACVFWTWLVVPRFR